MDIVVKGRNVEIPEHYRETVNAKLARLERYDRKAIRADVELLHERNPRQAKNCQRVEITLVGKGAPVRAEASAGDFYAALDVAINRLETRLKRKLDRRKVHYGQRSPVSVAEATAAAAQGGSTARQGTALLESPAETSLAEEVPEQSRSAEESYEPGRIVRVKEHPAHPMTVDQALYEMELVGHDFYLFNDAESGKPSVVYRRKGFDYGLIRLDEQAH
jgi:ribosomal subunit interface protein